MLIRRSTQTLLMALLLASLQSCAGSYFKSINPVPDSMAIIYVFRPPHDFADWQSQSVYVNDRKAA